MGHRGSFLEKMVKDNLFGGCYKGARVLVTGDTGFKGSWLIAWLRMLGAEVYGYSNAQEENHLHHRLLKCSYAAVRKDIANFDSVVAAVESFQPTIIFHLAAQALVRPSYRDPLGTFKTNVIGTANILEAARVVGSVKAVVNVTSDKCYHNNEWVWGYRESDPLGGYDPYSASKGCSEIITSSYRNSFGASDFLVASCRAGNVVGGGDWAADRLIPDMVRAISNDEVTCIRNPDATRPWQHVLEPLSGYLLVGQRLIESDVAGADSWNFGPSEQGHISVGKVSAMLATMWDFKIEYQETPEGLHEARLLKLDCSKANADLGWRPVWDIQKTLAETVAWYQGYLLRDEVITSDQIKKYIDDAVMADLCWCHNAV